MLRRPRNQMFKQVFVTLRNNSATCCYVLPGFQGSVHYILQRGVFWYHDPVTRGVVDDLKWVLCLPWCYPDFPLYIPIAITASIPYKPEDSSSFFFACPGEFGRAVRQPQIVSGKAFRHRRKEAPDLLYSAAHVIEFMVSVVLRVAPGTYFKMVSLELASAI